MNPVVHFEMPVEDRDRASDFYSKAFGWKADKMGPEMGEYVVVKTTESDEKGPKKPGAINGGLFKRTKPDQVPSVVIGVDDINAAIEKVKSAGGTVLGGMGGPDKPDDIPGVGLYVSILDTEGNRVGVIQPAPMQ
jgi:hypothetical protein